MAMLSQPVTDNDLIDPDSDGTLASTKERQRRSSSPLSSLKDYPVLWGRSYPRYREGCYHFPNDQKELDRLDFQHHIFKRYFNNRLFFSELNPKTTTEVLDIGTGTGCWCIDLSDSRKLPNAQITGVDLSPVQPTLVPENVTFEILDCAGPDWLQEPGSIDFIHSRFMAGSLESYKKMIQTARKYLRPGTGWLELHEIHPQPMCDDGTMPNNWRFKEWEAKLHDASTNKIDPPRPIRIAENLKAWMESSGYVDVREHRYKIPLSPWPRDEAMKEIGGLNKENWLEGLDGFSYKLFGPEGLQLSREEIEVMMIDVRKSLSQRHVHAYTFYHVVCGRRPAEKGTGVPRWGHG